MLNNDLVEYLNKYFQNPADVNEANLNGHFLTKFGVNAKPDKTGASPRWLFDYDQMTVKWTYPLSHICRGIIVESQINTNNLADWSIVSWGFNKFFNLKEPSCPITEAEYAQNPQGYRLLSKEDGTLIHLYQYRNDWAVSTRGAIVTERYNDQPYTFESLFWDTIQKDVGVDRATFLSRLDKAPYTYMYELSTPYNRIVSKYPSPQVCLLGQRDLTYGRLMTHGEVDMTARQLGVRRPKFYFCNEYKTYDQLIAFVEKDSFEIAPGDPEYKEGFVLYNDTHPIGKMKNQKYLLLHSIMGGHDSIYTLKNIVRCYFGGTLDDVYPALPVELQRGADKLKGVMSDLVKDIIECAQQIRTQHDCKAFDNPKEEQKQYALKVLKLVPKVCGGYAKYASGYFFMCKADVISGALGSFTDYLKDNCEKQIDYWKDLVRLGL